MGNIAESTSGKSCLSWTGLAPDIAELLEISNLTADYFPDHSLAEAGSYCRYMLTSWHAPSCFVDYTVFQESSIEICDVPYCGEHCCHCAMSVSTLF